MAGTGLIEFAWYDYPWMLVVVGWLPISLLKFLGHAALWLDVKRESKFDWRVTVTGLWGGCLVLVAFAGAVGPFALSWVLAISYGFAIFLHMGTLTAQIWKGRKLGKPSWAFGCLILLQPFTFTVYFAHTAWRTLTHS